MNKVGGNDTNPNSAGLDRDDKEIGCSRSDAELRTKDWRNHEGTDFESETVGARNGDLIGQCHTASDYQAVIKPNSASRDDQKDGGETTLDGNCSSRSMVDTDVVVTVDSISGLANSSVTSVEDSDPINNLWTQSNDENVFGSAPDISSEPPHHWFQKSHSEERSVETTLEKFSPKSASCIELDTERRQLKESHTKQLFRNLKRVVTNSAMKHNEAMCNMPSDVFGNTPANQLRVPSEFMQRSKSSNLENSTSQCSSWTQSVPPSSLRVEKLEPHTTEDANSQLPDSPNSPKYGFDGQSFSSVPSRASLNTSRDSPANSEEVFSAKHYSLDRSAKPRPTRRKSRKSTSTESSKGVCAKENSPKETQVRISRQSALESCCCLLKSRKEKPRENHLRLMHI